eukprot:CAMPEP_0119345208 /NCGR_PEP_ID=MMETSP1333-20130426/107366_1 /TAXON_ID=418940 /ORGANISM="Scyphosphaera apsteinii, Strain RCC1455" /LENGTH=90 /DNA_ID=CAMNT_0007357667 /DNA_START=487 /DNA_END=759 /DNA_ORIENTATION=-
MGRVGFDFRLVCEELVATHANLCVVGLPPSTTKTPVWGKAGGREGGTGGIGGWEGGGGDMSTPLTVGADGGGIEGGGGGQGISVQMGHLL